MSNNDSMVGYLNECPLTKKIDFIGDVFWNYSWKIEDTKKNNLHNAPELEPAIGSKGLAGALGNLLLIF